MAGRRPRVPRYYVLRYYSETVTLSRSSSRNGVTVTVYSRSDQPAWNDWKYTGIAGMSWMTRRSASW